MSEIQETKQVIADLKDKIKAKEDVEALYRNGAFKRLILKNFCEDKVLKQMQLAVVGICNDKEDIKADALSGLYLKNWLQTIITLGLRAEEQLPNYEEELNSLIAENRGDE